MYCFLPCLWFDSGGVFAGFGNIRDRIGCGVLGSGIGFGWRNVGLGSVDSVVALGLDWNDR